MKILMVDDEPLALKRLTRVTREACPEAELFSADMPKEALELAEKEKPEVVFLDIEMPGMTGLELGKKLKEINPRVNIIFMTAYSEYVLEATKQYFSGYLLKPPTVEKVKEGLENLRYPLEEAQKEAQKEEGLCVRCFGQFQVLYNGEHIKFARKKTMELFAYLVDLRGAPANTEELCEALWSEELICDTHKSYLRNLVTDLKQTLKKYGKEEVFHKDYNTYYIDPNQIKCDYYDYLNGDQKMIDSYQGEYMTQYSWALMATRWKN